MTSDEPQATPQARRRAAPRPGPQPTNGATDPARVDLLDRYWDAVTGNGYQRAEAIAVDPVRARTVDQLQTLATDHSAGIPADARARIWRATATEAGIPTRQEPPVASSSSPAGGLAAPALTLPASSPSHAHVPASPGGRAIVPGGGRPSQPTGRALWPRLQFAIAAVLILGLFATILAPMDDESIDLFGGMDSTPTTTASMTTPPSIGYPEAFTGGGSLIDLPVSATGHTISIDRVTVASGARLTLPPGSARTVSSVTESFTADRGGGSAPLTVDQPSQIDIGLAGGSVSADQGEDVTITVLTIAPEDNAPLASTNGVTIYPLTSYTTGAYRFETQINVVFGNGPVPGTPEQVGPLRSTGVPADDQQYLSLNGTTMLLYAEEGAIRLTSQWDSIGDPASGSDQFPGVRDLTLSAGEAAVSSDAFATIQQVTPGEGAVYTVAFISPPPIDQTPGRTYPNTTPFYGDSGPIAVPADGNDYQVVLDRLTLQAGAIATFEPGTFRSVQWTGGGDVTMTVSGGAQSPFTIPDPTLNGSFDDQGFSLVANGDAPVTVTLMSFLPAGTAGETVPGGRDGLSVERLAAYVASNPTGAPRLQLSLTAGPALARQDTIDPLLNWSQGIDVANSYAIIRAEGGPIILDRPVTPIDVGRWTTPIAAGDQVQPGQTVFLDAVGGATIRAADPNVPAGYTAVVVAPEAVQIVAPAGSGTAAALAGLIPGNTSSALQTSAATAPTTVALYRLTLAPGAELDNPAGGATQATYLTYAAAGSVVISGDYWGGITLTAGSLDHVISSNPLGGRFTIQAGAEGATLYQLVIGGSGWSGFAPGTTTSELLAGTTIADLVDAAAAGNGTVDITAGMVVQEISTGPVANSTRTFGDDGTVTIFTPLTSDLEIRPNTGGIGLIVTDGGTDGTPLSEPATVSPGTSIVASANATFDVVTPDQPTAYLMTQVSVEPTRDSDLATAAAQARLDRPAGRPAATPVTTPPAIATPVTAG